MKNNKGSILVVDDERDICRALEFILSKDGYDVQSALSAEEALQKLQKRPFDLVLTDLRMEGMDGLALLEEIKSNWPETEVIMMTAYATVENAVEAMKKGASDYIVKPFNNEDVRLRVARVLKQRQLQLENEALRRQLSQKFGCREVIAESPQMMQILSLLEQVIPIKSNILIRGESGTGKGLIAEVIHCNSPRKDKPFMSINCSAIPEHLLESELFGYKKGAFTGASSDKTGLIVMADGGTLFLDEIGDMPLTLQAKLLKVIETGEVLPLGDTRTRKVDIRIIAATHQDLEKLIKEGHFREDLYYRLNVIEIVIPPLRERKEDIPLLVEHFIRKFSRENNKEIQGISKDAMDAIMNYSWPGNVRELANAIERAVVFAKGPLITLNELPQKIQSGPEITGGSLKDTLNYFEKKIILDRLQQFNWQKEQVAKSLGIDLATLYRKMKKLGIRE